LLSELKKYDLKKNGAQFIATIIVISDSLLPTHNPHIIHSTSTHPKFGLCIRECKVVFE